MVFLTPSMLLGARNRPKLLKIAIFKKKTGFSPSFDCVSRYQKVSNLTVALPAWRTPAALCRGGCAYGL